jgi:hypothetical protein
VDTASGRAVDLLDIRLVGCEYEEADVEILRREFDSFGALRVTGRGSTGAGAGLEVTSVLYFLGGAFVTFVLDKAFDGVWERFRRGWTRFRDDRRRRHRSDPSFGGIVIRTDDIEVEIRPAFTDADPPDLGGVLALMGERLTSGSLSETHVDRITVPPPRWAEAPAERAGDPLLWYVASRSLEDRWGLYDAKEDCWLEEH